MSTSWCRWVGTRPEAQIDNNLVGAPAGPAHPAWLAPLLGGPISSEAELEAEAESREVLSDLEVPALAELHVAVAIARELLRRTVKIDSLIHDLIAGLVSAGMSIGTS